MASTDDRNLSDCDRAKAEIHDIHKQRELVVRNLMKLLGRGHFAGCRKWTTWGEGKGGGLGTWSIGQGIELVKTIEDNLGLRREYLSCQEK
jgi:hypothetical protein